MRGSMRLTAENGGSCGSTPALTEHRQEGVGVAFGAGLAGRGGGGGRVGRAGGGDRATPAAGGGHDDGGTVRPVAGSGVAGLGAQHGRGDDERDPRPPATAV